MAVVLISAVVGVVTSSGPAVLLYLAVSVLAGAVLIAEPVAARRSARLAA